MVQNLLPDTPNTYYLGTSTDTWKEVNAVTANIGTWNAVSVTTAFDMISDGTFLANGTMECTAVTASTTPDTGAFVVAGGVGIGGALNVESTITATGPMGSLSTADSQDVQTGSLILAGGAGIAKSLHVGGHATLERTLTVQEQLYVEDDIKAEGISLNTNSVLSVYEENTTVTLTHNDGGSDVNVDYKVTKVGSDVTIFVPSWSITTTTNGNPSFIGTTNYLPTRFIPTTAQWCDVIVIEGSTKGRGGYVVNTNGSLELYKDAQNSNWAAGTNGVPIAQTIRYKML